MKMNRFGSAILSMAVLQASAVMAEEHVIKAAGVQFDPQITFAQPGDTISWTNMAAHDTASIEGMIPEEAAPWRSKMSENLTITVEKEGAYVYQCTPHVGAGMVGAIVVGNGVPSNLEAIEKHPQNKAMVGRAIRKLKQALQSKGTS